jgi:hypothetical protein
MIKDFSVDKILKPRFFRIWLIGLSLIALLQAYWLMPRHFTHVDDIGVAESLLIRNMDYQDDCQKNLSEVRGKILLTIFKTKDRTCAITKKLNRLYTISGIWTYAPAQFWLTQALLDPNKKYTYEEVKFNGRLPSFIFYVIGAIAFYSLLRFNMGEVSRRPILCLALATLIVFSLENRIFASQMHSYAIGILANVFALFAYLRLCRFETHAFKSIFISSILFALSVAMQYQALLMVSAGLSSIFIIHLLRVKKLKWYFFSRYIFLSCTTIFGIYILVGNILGLSSRGLNWNVGPNGEFIVKGTTAIERFLDLGKLLLIQTPENVYAILSGIWLQDVAAYIFGLIVIFICILGVLYLWKSRAQEHSLMMIIFLTMYGLIYSTLILFGKLSFAPTRHFLFYLPIVLILLGYGALELRRWISIAVMKAGFLAYCIFSLVLFPVFAQGRFDKLSTGIFNKLAHETNASFVLYGVIDVEPLFTDAASGLPLFWYVPSELDCNHKEILVPPNRTIRFMTYSKQLNNQVPELENLRYVEDLIRNCTTYTGTDKKTISIDYLRHLIDSPSQTSNELSNRVIRSVHDNNSFIRLYEIKTNFDSNLYEATLEEGINFKKPSYPTFLKFVGGLSQHENWGRWTDANQGKAVLLGFKDSLPNRFSLELVVKSHPSNVGKATLIRVGQQEKIININDNNTHFSLDFETDGNIDLVEIIPPNFATQNLLSSAAQDPRRIGIGLVELKIKTKSKLP